jgi:SAM-dependent methyltransferase
MTLIEEAFLDIHRGLIRPFYIQIGKKKRREDLAHYFQGFKAFHPVEKALLGAARGRVFDAAAGAGRVGLALLGLGHEVVCGDVSPVMKRIATERGCPDYRIDDLLAPDRVNELFDTVVFMGNSLGFCRDETEVERVLFRLSHRIRPGGLLLMSATDPALFGLEESGFLPYIHLYRNKTEEAGWFLAHPALICGAIPDSLYQEALMSHKGMNGFFFRKRDG